mmetsp:Transcript_24137/g.67659  ORF Transcript_24137/g.67659 Transcript_24137/m.67659 type:complete len:339 (-) Transcript_24137:15-1031(-)
MGSSASLRSIPVMSMVMSSNPNGTEGSSSRRKEVLALLELVSSTICCFIWARTSPDTVSVPYLSSQYMVLMRYSCWTLSTGQRSFMISSSDFLGFWWITRNPTACRICSSSSDDLPTHFSPAPMIHDSSSVRPIFTYSPFVNEQHSRRSSSWLNSCTFTKAKICENTFRTRKGGTWLDLSVSSSLSITARMAFQCAAFALSETLPPLLFSAPRGWRGAWMQLWIGTAMSRLMLSRMRLKIFCTKASSCCLNKSAGYLASTSLTSDSVSSTPPGDVLPPPAAGLGDARPKNELRLPKPPNRLAPTVTELLRLRDCMPASEGGLMYRRNRASKVTVFASQ